MSEEVFKQVVERAEELEEMPELNFTGQGEPLLHKDIVEFGHHLQQKGHNFGITTNASLLDDSKAKSLLEAGLARITFSISDLGDDYEEVYNLDFDTTQKNIFNFLEINQGRAEVRISIVEHDINKPHITELKKFWREAGVQQIFHFPQVNRAGACNQGLYFVGNQQYVQEAEKILADNHLSSLCGTPFKFMFVGWNGNHYICCNDYEKRNPLGTVFDFGFAQMDEIKTSSMAKGISACMDCSIDPINSIREALFEINNDETDDKKLSSVVDQLKTGQAAYPELFEDLDWKKSLIACTST